MSNYKVILTLTKVRGDDEFTTRTVTLRPGNPVEVGRSSSDPAKAMLAGPDNLFLSSPVISRHHAELTCISCGPVGLRWSFHDYH
jgi:hypothetical protein